MMLWKVLHSICNMLAPGSDRIPVELFQILKDDAVESTVVASLVAEQEL